jgi:hypothetical protein
MNLAEAAEGRIISQQISVRMTPPQDGRLGHTDAACEIGRGLIKEAVELIRAAGEKEGFIVEIEATQVIY